MGVLQGMKKLDKAIPIAGKAIYLTFASTRAKMLGKTYVDVLTFLAHELSLPEKEENWKRRQDLIIELTKILESRNKDVAIPNDLLIRVKQIIPQLCATANSERTSLSIHACRVIIEIARNLETHLQPHLDIFLPQLITLCGSTKKVNQQNASDVIVAICKHAGYSPRLFYHVRSAFQEKRIPPRIYAPEWLQLLLQRYHKQMHSDTDGVLARKAIHEGLVDGQLKVRENCRAVYWEYAKYDPNGANEIMSSLNSHAASALRDDPHNPDKPSKSARPPRPESALAAAKAHAKTRQREQAKPNMASSVDSNAFAFGVMEDLDAGHDKMTTKTNKPSHPQKENKPVEPNRGAFHKESKTSTQSATSGTMHQKPSKPDAAKESKTSTPRSDARPLLSAPVRRGRIVATPISSVSSTGPTHRPTSRGDPNKKSVDIKDRTGFEKSTGRSTPTFSENRASKTSASSHHFASTHHSSSSHISTSHHSRRNGRQTPVIAEDKTGPASPKEHTRSSRHTPAVVDKHEISTTVSTQSGTERAPDQEFVGSMQSAISGLSVDGVVDDDGVVESKAEEDLLATAPLIMESIHSTQVGLSPERVPFQRVADSVPSATNIPTESVPHQHIAEGKENTMVLPQRKKSSPSASSQRSPSRSPQKVPRSIPSAKKSLATAIECLRYRSLDALGYRRLKKLIDDHPGVLITKQAQFNDLFELLIRNLTSFDEITESRHKRSASLHHPLYNRHVILNTLIALFQQYPQWPEPEPGLTLCTLLIARVTSPEGLTSVISSIDDSAYLLCAYSQDPLPTIDGVLDTLQQIERLITSSEPVHSPNSWDSAIMRNSFDSLASEFGPERPKFAQRLPSIIAFGTQLLTALLQRLAKLSIPLFTVQEDRLAQFGEHLLATYTSLIRRRIMSYILALHAVIKPEKRFFSYFKNETDKNLIQYYVAGSLGTVHGSLGNTGRIVPLSPPEEEIIASEPSTFQPGSEANWEVLGTTVDQ